jgi:DNA-binding NarL/FixJ family response regulator
MRRSRPGDSRESRSCISTLLQPREAGRQPRRAEPAELTDREREVLALVRGGATSYLTAIAGDRPKP